jgi:hypothetical protein
MKFKEGQYVKMVSYDQEHRIFRIEKEENKVDSEYHSRYTIKCLNTGLITEGSYLHNGHWRLLKEHELRELKLKRILNVKS